ncbi:hypothetical protein DH2020_046344 [Rehmannia glutinosa]|uniref:RING-type domain-containing protein n=1 Tax=Rehmannia glutinosa TaxID=99300 RepID=A0ABR0UBU6_REHGL
MMLLTQKNVHRTKNIWKRSLLILFNFGEIPHGECQVCSSIDPIILHNICHRGAFALLCTACVLRYHDGSFCPICFDVYEDTSNNGGPQLSPASCAIAAPPRPTSLASPPPAHPPHSATSALSAPIPLSPSPITDLGLALRMAAMQSVLPKIWASNCSVLLKLSLYLCTRQLPWLRLTPSGKSEKLYLQDEGLKRLLKGSPK